MNKWDVMVVDRGAEYVPEILISEVDVAVIYEKEYVYPYVETESLRESKKLLGEILGVDIIPLVYFPSPKEKKPPLLSTGRLSMISGNRICMN